MGPRRRASTLKAPVKGHEELESHLKKLGPRESDEDDLQVRIDAAHLVRQYLLISPPESHVKDAFRHLDGFLTLLNVLEQVLILVIPRHASSERLSLLIELVQTTFSILSTAFESHEGNQRYFKERVRDNGWRSLHSILSQILQKASISGEADGSKLSERVFGCLLACALEDESLVSLFTAPPEKTSVVSPDEPDASSHTSTPDISRTTSGNLQTINDLISKILRPSTRLYHGESAVIMLELWRTMDRPITNIKIALGVPKLLLLLAELSTHNMCELLEAHMTRTLLSEILCSENDPEKRNDDIYKLAKTLFSLGVDELEDACSLYRNAKTSSSVAELLLSALNCAPKAPFVHFDLSLRGYCSIELPALAHSFPPSGNISGYTVTLWFEVVKFDPHAHTTLFGAFDSSQTCFLLIYLEKDTHNLIFQTSIKSSKPSVRFKSVKFKEGHWYHVALTHRRPKATSSSRASLFIDGEFVEEVKSQYPALPPRTDAAPNIVVSSTSRHPVQAFLGTPQDLASRVGKNIVHTTWRLSSAQLFSEILSDDLIAVYFRLGPKYSGNYQDCLGSFQTYEASAQLSLRNEGLNPGKDEASDLVTAIRSKGGEVLAEHSILLNISSTNIFGGFQLVRADFRPLDRVSKSAFRNLLQVTQGGRSFIALNGAFSSFNDSLSYAAGHAILTGCPTVVSKDAIDRSAWRLGGCTPVCLSLLESSDIEGLLRNMQIFFAAVGNDWRNSEAIERDNGFSIFANILSSKLKKFDTDYALREEIKSQSTRIANGRPSLRSLHLILEFVGLCKEKPEESIINNPLAYRILLVDTDVWRTLSSDVQKVYYAQFKTFLKQSKYHGFNAKRLSRMRIVKKWIESLRYLSFSRVTFEYFLEGFKILTLKNFTSEVMRSLALYITYAVYEPENLSLGSSPWKGTASGTASPARRKTISSPSPSETTPTDFGDGFSATIGRIDVAVGMLETYNAILCQQNDRTNIDRFARAVTNKWLLYLLADTSPSVLVPTMKILGQLLVSSGPQYMKKFTERANGIIIMQHWLQRHWSLSALWNVCFAILFGKDIAEVDFGRFDHFSLIENFGSDGQVTVVLPEILPVIMSLFRNGLISVTHEDTNQRSAPLAKQSTEPPHLVPTASTHRSRASSLTVESANRSYSAQSTQKTSEDGIAIMRTVTRFLADVHEKSLAFRDLAATSFYIQELFHVIYPVVVGCGALSAETELSSRASDLTFKGEEVAMKPFGADSSTVTPAVRTSLIDKSGKQSDLKPKAPRRMSSYVLVTSKKSEQTPKLQPAISPKQSRLNSNISSVFMQEVLEILLGVFADQIFVRKDFPGLGLFMRVPAGFQEHQAYFETFVFRNALSHLSNTIRLDQRLLWEPRVLTNIARLAVHLSEAVYEGWFIEGAHDTFHFLVAMLEYLHIPEISSIKSVRLCASTIQNIQAVLHRIILLRLSDLYDQDSMSALADYLENLAFWQTALFSPQESSLDFLRLLIYLLYTQLDCGHDRVRSCAANLWRQLLVHKTNEISEILNEADTGDNKILSKGFEKIMELDNETFLTWFDDHRSGLDGLFKPVSRYWTSFVVTENRHTEETARARIAKRRDRLKIVASEDLRRDDILHRHETSSKIWRTNIYHNEHTKRQRTLQDQLDTRIFNNSAWSRMQQELYRPCGLFEDGRLVRWRLDETEGRNRMRMRLLPDKMSVNDEFQPKRRQSGLSIRKRSSMRKASKEPIASRSRADLQLVRGVAESFSDAPSIVEPNSGHETEESDDDFEIVENPHGENGDPEDKHRKVMRCIQRGDLVENVDNASRIVGLEAIEGLLICGRHYLYLLDDLFRRIDGEIINAAQAPEDERDQYLQMISGQKTSRKEIPTTKPSFESRSWRWDEILSISKRRFLFRDVAIEIFFVDGQSYLFTTKDSISRDEIYQRLQSKAIAPSVRTSSSQEEYGWRIESLRNPDEDSQSLGTRFTSVFAQQANTIPATKRWIRGEISNFHYLMLINTMAGRSYNDLTQYPVFPWIIADYTSDELDLSNPGSFRDLTKPMGCQTKEREAEFKDRYQSFSEMADENAPPFHYGTHYSSAMIVTSYLIRLQPFVQSYLLLQGGSFDHADRLFFSIERTWKSASRENMSDVRELIPEFFYSPEFLSNINDYDFGERQSTGAKIDNVALPPWAKNDPKIFIAKQREALESEYVTTKLQAWIDLIFGHKQRGSAALEATNVFHHLSYHGAKDLDKMEDPVERLATIGIIHNFGQTPLQVFNRPHPQRDQYAFKAKRLDVAAETLVRLPFPVLESSKPISSLHWSVKTQKLSSSGPSRIVLGPTFDKYVEWGFFDGSVRFYVANGHRLIGLLEHIHVGHVLSILFADPKTMVTASTDCTVSIWTVTASTKSVELQTKRSLFGHKEPVAALAVSRSLSVLLSASTDGVVILWDLNRGELVRVLTKNCVVECARVNDVTGHVVLCQASEISIWTLNGDLIVRRDLHMEGDDSIISCAFFEGNGHEYLERQLLFTGHKRGVVNIWNLTIRDGAFVIEHVKRLHHMDQAGFDIGASITAILPMEQTVYTGDDDGRVYEWDCVQRQ